MQINTSILATLVFSFHFPLSTFLLNNDRFFNNGFLRSKIQISKISNRRARMPKAWNCSSKSL